jgi:hypothetical protein
MATTRADFGQHAFLCGLVGDGRTGGNRRLMRKARSRIRTPSAASWSRNGRLWECPTCRKQYPRAGQAHSCVVVSLDALFHDRPRARELFEAFRAAVEAAAGPVRLSIAETRIGLMNEITFAAVMPRKNFLRAHLVLRRMVSSPRFVRIDAVKPYWVHVFEIRDERAVDAELRALIRESYALGAPQA